MFFGRCLENQIGCIFRSRCRKRHQFRADRTRRCFHSTDGYRQRPSRNGRTERNKPATVEIAELFSLTPIHAEQISRTRHVDVEECAAHQEVRRFRRNVLGELRKPLRRDDPGKPALSATTHQVGHRAQRLFARFVRHFAGRCGGKKLRFVHHDQHRVPIVALGIEHAAKECRGSTHLLLDVQPFKVENNRNAVLPDPRGDPLQFGFRARRIDNDMAESIRQSDEIALRINHTLLHPRGRLFEQAT